MELFQSFATHDCLEPQSVVLAGNDGANRFMGAALSIKDQAGVVEASQPNVSLTTILHFNFSNSPFHRRHAVRLLSDIEHFFWVARHLSA